MSVARIIPNEPDDEWEPPAGNPVRPAEAKIGTGVTMLDPPTERALVGSVFIKPECYDVAVAAGVTASTFTDATLGLVWQVFDRLHGDGQPLDPITVHARAQRERFDIPKPDALYELGATEGFKTSNAGAYAETLVGYARARYFYTQALGLSNGKFGVLRDELERISKEWDAQHNTTNEGLFADMQAVMESDSDPVTTSVWRRDDGPCLMYAPGINWLSGEPGEGKSLLAAHVVAEELLEGNTCLWLDFEGTAEGLASRLKEMGVEDVSRLHYRRVTDPFDPSTLAALRAAIKDNGYTVAVIDAVAGAMEAEGLNPESNPDVEKWVALIPQMLFAAGAGVICIDHVAKNKETRGKWAIGAQRKQARADAAFLLEMFEKAAPGQTGRGKLRVTKDRYGALAAVSVGRVAAHIAIVSHVADDGTRDLVIGVAPPEGAPGGDLVTGGPTWYMEQVSRIIERAGPDGVGIKAIKDEMKGRKWQHIDKAIELLIEMGCIEILDVKGRARPYVSLLPYRQPYVADDVIDNEPQDVPERYGD